MKDTATTPSIADMLVSARQDAEQAQRRVVVLDRVQAAMDELQEIGCDPNLEVVGTWVSLSLDLGGAAPRALPSPAAPVVEPVQPAPQAEMVEKAPRDEPESQPAATAAPAAKPERRAGPFDAAEDAAIREAIKAGQSTAEIATGLNRAPQGVSARIRVLNDQDGAPTTPPRAARPSTSRAAGPEDDMSNGMPASEREVRRRVRRLGYPAPWNAQRDLALVEALLSGRKLDGAAEAAKVTTLVAKARWEGLCPDRSWDTQMQLLATLRKIAGEG